MSKTVYYTATTLDGFIADENHSLDWLFTRDREPGGALDYEDFIAGVGAVAMGRTTYEWILEHQSGTWPYDVPSWVFTHGKPAVVPSAAIEFASGSVADAHPALVEAADGRDVWIVGGGDLAGQFADAGLLDEVLVTIAPVTIGAGAPLLPRRVELRVEEIARNGDFVAARYSVVRPG
jgi:dihydrofolate reductase